MVYNRRNIKNSIIIAALIISISVSPIFATTIEVEIEHNDNEYFHAYNSNTNVVNSLIDSGAAVFSKAFNYMAQNIAKTTSSTYAIHTVLSNVYTRLGTMNTSLTNIATDIGLIKQSNVSQTNSLSSILANSNLDIQYISQIAGTLGYQTTGNLVDIKNSLENIEWVSEPISYGYYGRLNDAVNQTNQLTQGAYDHIYIRVDFTNEIFSKALKVVFPVIPYNTMNLNNENYYIAGVYTPTNNMLGTTPISTTRQRLYFYNQNHTSAFYFDGSGFTMSNGNYRRVLIFDISGTQNSYIYTGQNTLAYSIGSDKEDYYKIANYINLSKLSTDDIVNALDNLSVEAEFDDSGIIDAINNLSLQDNDVKLNLTINNNTGNDGTNIITRLQTFFNTGVSVSDFFDNVDDAESGWFTQSNSDIINTLSGGYTDFYE